MRFWYPFIILKQRGWEFRNSTHWITFVIKRLYSFPLIHVRNLLFWRKIWFFISEINVWKSLTTKDLDGKTFKEVLMSLFLSNRSLRENLNNKNQLPIILDYFVLWKKHYQSCKLEYFCRLLCLGQYISNIWHFICSKQFIHLQLFNGKEYFKD